MDTQKVLEEVDALMTRACKPLPKMTLTLAGTNEIRQRFGKDGDGWIDPFFLRTLYDRLLAEGYHDDYSEREKRYLPRLMFEGLDVDRRALVSVPTLFATWCRAMATNEESVHRDRILRYFFNSEVAADSENVALSVFVGSFSQLLQCRPLVIKGLLCREQVENVVAQLAPDRLVTDSVPRLTDGLAKADSPFCREVWIRSLMRVREYVEDCWENEAQFCALLSKVKSESVLPSGAFRWRNKRAVEGLASALLEPFMPGKNRLPCKEVEDALREFWCSLFGDPDDTRTNHRWYGVDEKYRSLISHWAKGRKLISALDFLREYSRSQAFRWKEREAFLRPYWNAGRVLDCRIYVREPSFAWQRELIAKFKGRCQFGTVSGVAYDQAVLFVLLEDRVLLAEVNYNGRFHVGNAMEGFDDGKIVFDENHKRALYFESSFFRYSIDIVPFGVAIYHNGAWEKKAHAAIAERSGRPSPFSAMG